MRYHRYRRPITLNGVTSRPNKSQVLKTLNNHLIDYPNIVEPGKYKTFSVIVNPYTQKIEYYCFREMNTNRIIIQRPVNHFFVDFRWHDYFTEAEDIQPYVACVRGNLDQYFSTLNFNDLPKVNINYCDDIEKKWYTVSATQMQDVTISIFPKDNVDEVCIAGLKNRETNYVYAGTNNAQGTQYVVIQPPTEARTGISYGRITGYVRVLS